MASAAKLDKTYTTDEKFDDTAADESTPLLEKVEDDEIFAKEEVTKNLDATQLYLRRNWFFSFA